MVRRNKQQAPAALDLRVARVERRLRQAGVVFGPCLAEGDIAAFEERAGVVLPDEHRSFLRQVGNGGDGPPLYGLVPLGEVSAGADGEAPGLMLARLSHPFASRAWVDERGSSLEGDPPPAGIADGLLHLGTDGCGEDYELVVSGAARGQVWRSEPGAAYPCVSDFLAWYELWLDRDRKRLDPLEWPLAQHGAPKSKRANFSLQQRVELLGAEIKRRGCALGPALSEAQLAAFERRAGVELPPAYRLFLREVGNGSAGRLKGPPLFGLAPLGVVDDYHLTADEVLARLPQPFYGRAWEPDERFEQAPAALDDGVLPLGTDGEAKYYLLVVSGPARGQVWRSTEDGVAPHAADFVRWIEEWVACMGQFQL